MHSGIFWSMVGGFVLVNVGPFLAFIALEFVTPCHDCVNYMGWPFTFFKQGATATNDALNYVVLMGGDYYGRVYKVPLFGPGEIKLIATYDNNAKGPDTNTPAWTGKLVAEARVKVGD